MTTPGDEQPITGGQVGGQFRVSIPGQPDQLADVASLQFMAASGAIRGNTHLIDVGTGAHYLAKDVPGVFSDKDYIVAVLLAVFLGELGVDRFYLGHIGVGVAKIVVGLVTCGIGSIIWWIIDMFLIITRQLPDSDGRPLA